MTKTANKKQYEKPKATKQKKMTFTTRNLASSEANVVCRQCSSCHGCR